MRSCAIVSIQFDTSCRLFQFSQHRPIVDANESVFVKYRLFSFYCIPGNIPKPLFYTPDPHASFWRASLGPLRCTSYCSPCGSTCSSCQDRLFLSCCGRTPIPEDPRRNGCIASRGTSSSVIFLTISERFGLIYTVAKSPDRKFSWYPKIHTQIVLFIASRTEYPFSMSLLIFLRSSLVKNVPDSPKVTGLPSPSYLNGIFLNSSLVIFNPCLIRQLGVNLPTQ